MVTILAKRNKLIGVPSERKRHVLSRHPEIEAVWGKIKETLEEPDEIRVSTYDDRVWIYYRLYPKLKKYLSVVVRIYDGGGLLLTGYVTDRIKMGKMI